MLSQLTGRVCCGTDSIPGLQIQGSRDGLLDNVRGTPMLVVAAFFSLIAAARAVAEPPRRHPSLCSAIQRLENRAVQARKKRLVQPQALGDMETRSSNHFLACGG